MQPVGDAHKPNVTGMAHIDSATASRDVRRQGDSEFNPWC